MMKWLGAGERSAHAVQALDHGQLRLIVLRLIEQHPRTASEIEAAVAEAFSGAGVDRPMIDNVLDMLEQLDYVRPGTHLPAYVLTADGLALLAAEWDNVEALFGRLRAPPVTPRLPRRIPRAAGGLLRARRLARPL